MSNRVEELERKAKELQAAVNGLTEELVETKERVRQLEDAVEVDDPAVRSKTVVESESEPEPEAASESSETADDPEAEAEAEADDDKREQRFVDADAHEKTLDNALGPEGNSDEEAKSEEKKGEETESESEESDIIVA